MVAIWVPALHGQVFCLVFPNRAVPSVDMTLSPEHDKVLPSYFLISVDAFALERACSFILSSSTGYYVYVDTKTMDTKQKPLARYAFSETIFRVCSNSSQ